MLGIFNRSEKKIEESLNKYGQILEEDINLKMRIKNKGKLYTTDVEYLKEKEVLFRCPTDNREIIRFNIDSIVEVNFISKGGLYKTKLSITDKIVKENILYYKGIITSKIEKLQRRDNYRLPIILDLNYTLLPKESMEFEGHTLDISIGGMLMETYENIYLNKNIRIKIDIDGKLYNIKSTILNRRQNFNSGTYLYHIKFDNLTNRHKNEISRFIYDKR